MVFLLSILNPEMINCCCSVAQSCPDLCDPMDCNIPGFPVLHYFLVLPQFMSIESVMLSNHFTLWCLLLHLPSIFQASGSFLNDWLFTSGGQIIGASALVSVLPVNILGWFSLGITDLIDALAVQGTLMSLLRHHNSKEWIVWYSNFLMIQLSQQHMITGKTIRIFASKMMFLLFNTLDLS